ncbi:MAG TPA: hypothetical protein VHQ24_09330 [Lachnospiraceae bacterium]|nr:hypothetical protein [Lachnospiraceae bacterium]
MLIKKVERTPMKIKTKKGIEIHSLSSPSIHAQVTRIKEKRNTSDLYLNKDDGNRVSRSAEKIRGIPKKEKQVE